MARRLRAGTVWDNMNNFYQPGMPFGGTKASRVARDLGEECLHGYMAPDATMFPVPIALAGAFDRDLVQRVNRVIAREMRAHGSHLALSPVVDIARDPRWGHIEETFGEDPYLCAEMGVASVLGLQGEGRTLAPGRVFATLKHMTLWCVT